MHRGARVRRLRRSAAREAMVERARRRFVWQSARGGVCGGERGEVVCGAERGGGPRGGARGDEGRVVEQVGRRVLWRRARGEWGTAVLLVEGPPGVLRELDPLEARLVLLRARQGGG